MHHKTHVNDILHSIPSNAELYINNHQIYKSNGFYAHKSYISTKFKSTLTDYKGVLHCEGFDYEEDPENLLERPFFTRRMKLYSRLDGFMLYGKLGIDFFTTSELLYPNMKVRIRLIRARPNFYMISENPNVSFGIVDCSLCTPRDAQENYHKKKKVSTSLCSSLVQLHGNVVKDLYHSCTTEPIHSKKYIKQRTYTSNSHCNEFKLCFYWLLCREPILVSTV